MNITFLIGNGFDLNLGLKTKYSDFYDFYLDDIIGDSEDITHFKKTILDNKELWWSDAELAFGKYTEKFEIQDGGAEIFCDFHEDFCKKLAIYLENEESKFLIDDNDQLLANEFTNSISNYYRFFREAQKNKIIESINQFGSAYIYNFINFNYTRTLDKFVGMVTSKLLGIRSYNNVNYSNRIGEILHVHGFTNQDMVLGVDNENQIHNLDIFKGQPMWFQYQIIKQRANEMNERLVDERGYKLIKNTDLFYIYGMSLGETDALWWKRIIEGMVFNKNIRLIIHKHEAPDRDLFSRRFRQFEDEEKTKFLGFYDLSDIDEATKNLLRNRIHIDSGNIFSGLQNIASQRVENFVALEQI